MDTYLVEFTDRKQVILRAPGMEQARILAQAQRITEGKTHAIRYALKNPSRV